MSEFKKIGENRWVVTVEADPDTHELFMPFPPDALAQVGWDFGDTITWKIDPLTQEVTLEKQCPEEPT
jgi:hypothetical protein